MSIRYIDANELIGKVDMNTQDIINSMPCVYVDGILPNNQHFNLAEHDSKLRKSVYDDVLETIDAGVCDYCKHKDFDDKCFNNCTHELEALKEWIKEQKK